MNNKQDMDIRRLFARITGRKSNNSQLSDHATIITRDKHNISRKRISPNVLRVLKTLNNANFQAYIVGGGVRDLLCNKNPKDFDVATDAKPEQVRKLFRNCRLIGKRFRLAHIYFRGEIIEVATFRGSHKASEHHQTSEHGIITRDNVYGNIEDDAVRRDFTINALYYTTTNFSVLDFTDGMQDIEHKQLRMIGDPSERYREDPVRMLRAIRLASKLNFVIEPKTAKPLLEHSQMLEHISGSRLFDETVKIFHCGHAARAFEMLKQYNLLGQLLPTLSALINKKEPYATKLIEASLRNTDERIANDKPVSPIFLFAVLLWPILRTKQQYFMDQGSHQYLALEEAFNETIQDQAKTLNITKRIIGGMRDIYRLQPQLEKRAKNKIGPVMHHKRFRAAYDLLLLRNQAGESLEDQCQWWSSFQKASKQKQQEMVDHLPKVKRPKRKRTRKK